MIRIFLPLLCAALGLAAASCGQSEGPFGPAGAPALPSATSQGAAAAAMPVPEPTTSRSTVVLCAVTWETVGRRWAGAKVSS